MDHPPLPARRGRYSLLIVVLVIFLIFIATPAVTVLPYPLARPLAALKLRMLDSMSDTLRDQSEGLRPTLLAVDPEDREAHAELLSQDQTGIARLIDSSAPDRLPISGDNYDFLADDHGGRKRHIRLTGGMFETGFAGGEEGMFVLVGDQPLHAITPEHSAVKTLVDLAPATLTIRERETALWQARGKTLNGLTLSDAIPAQLNQTVLLRSVIDETDTVIAIRPIRKDTDGSLIILWKIVRQL